MYNFLDKNISRFGFILITSFFSLLLLWWLRINLVGLVDTNENYWFNLFLGLFVFSGGILGITRAKLWGGYSSYIGKAILFLSLGLIAWGLGTLIIGYYNFFALESYPYPSLADVSYIAAWPLWFVGMINLSKATGARYRLGNIKGKIWAGCIILASVLLSYYLLVTVAREGSFFIDNESYLRLFFDFAYPVGGVVILTASLILIGLSFNYLGGVFKKPIIMIIVGFILNYVSDVSFTYTNTIGTFYVGGWVDLIYLVTFLFLGMGIFLLDPSKLSTSRHEHNNV